MLFTRCPDCDTTFRVTDEALKKANGQVRCGRCASVFNAYAELHEGGAKVVTALTEPEKESGPAAAPRPADIAAVSIGASSVDDVVTEIGVATAQATADEPADENAPEADEIDAQAVHNVLAPADPMASTPWQLEAAPTESRASRRWWSFAAAVAALALGVQAAHHFRAQLAGNAVVGTWVQDAYAKLGVRVTPHWDVHQYEILDWVATAEPNARGLGSLKITARIKNNGPQRQPYPEVQLRLKDRWEDAVGSRRFAPTEYLSRDTPRGRFMTPGETARAEIEVVDPGPDAYGFELDVCIEVEADLLTCGTDKVFL